jgi:hypothetical protein
LLMVPLTCGRRRRRGREGRSGEETAGGEREAGWAELEAARASPAAMPSSHCPQAPHLVAPRPKPAAGLEVHVRLGAGGGVEQGVVAVGVDPGLACGWWGGGRVVEQGAGTAVRRARQGGWPAAAAAR